MNLTENANLKNDDLSRKSAQMTFSFTDSKPQIVAERADEELKLRLGSFDGPLDLLLHLIKKEEVNIYDIPIARITDEYLRYLRLMEQLDISLAGDFLVMAASLIEIKSKMLLPREPLVEIGETEEEDPREALVKQLLEHQKYKSAAEVLWSKATVEHSVFRRGKIDSDSENSEINVGLYELISTFQKILARHKEEAQMEIAREEMTLAQMLETLKERLIKDKRIKINDFFEKARSRRELVLAFLAVLEVVKTTSAKLEQNAVFGDIFLQA